MKRSGGVGNTYPDLLAADRGGHFYPARSIYMDGSVPDGSCGSTDPPTPATPEGTVPLTLVDNMRARLFFNAYGVEKARPELLPVGLSETFASLLLESIIHSSADSGKSAADVAAAKMQFLTVKLVQALRTLPELGGLSQLHSNVVISMVTRASFAEVSRKQAPLERGAPASVFAPSGAGFERDAQRTFIGGVQHHEWRLSVNASVSPPKWLTTITVKDQACTTAAACKSCATKSTVVAKLGSRPGRCRPAGHVNRVYTTR